MRVMLGSVLLLLCVTAYANCWNSNTRLDFWCAAEAYDAKGLHQLAATMRCEIWQIRKHFGTRDQCVVANTYEPPQEHVEHEEAEAEVHDNLEQRLETVARKQREYEQNRREYAQQALLELKEVQE